MPDATNNPLCFALPADAIAASHPEKRLQDDYDQTPSNHHSSTSTDMVNSVADLTRHPEMPSHDNVQTIESTATEPSVEICPLVERCYDLDITDTGSSDAIAPDVVKTCRSRTKSRRSRRGGKKRRKKALSSGSNAVLTSDNVVRIISERGNDESGSKGKHFKEHVSPDNAVQALERGNDLSTSDNAVQNLERGNEESGGKGKKHVKKVTISSDNVVQSLERGNELSIGDLKNDTAVHILERGKIHGKETTVNSTSDNAVQILERGNDAKCNGGPSKMDTAVHKLLERGYRNKTTEDHDIGHRLDQGG